MCPERRPPRPGTRPAPGGHWRRGGTAGLAGAGVVPGRGPGPGACPEGGRRAAGRALDGVTDSPAFLDGRFTGTAGFHGIDLAAHCDQLTAALAHAAEVSAARCHRLLDPRVTGLPAQLAARPGPETGLVTVH